jgi:hypothetical protein
MKNKFFTAFIILIVSVYFISCTSEDNTIEEQNKLDLSNLDIKLNLKFDLGKSYSISNVSEFISENYNDIIKLDEDLILMFEINGKSINYSIETVKTLINKAVSLNKSDPLGHYDKANCVKCRSRECVANALADAVGDGDEQVFVSVTPNYTLGVRTSVTVCSGTLKEIIAAN